MTTMPDAEYRYFPKLRVVDLGVGLAAALVTRMLHQFGAAVVRVEPDGGDPCRRYYAAYDEWHSGARRASRAELPALLDSADICIVGGEDVAGLDWTFDPSVLRAERPQLVVLDLAAIGEGRYAVEVLAQARSGLAFEHHPDRPLHFAFQAAGYGAALQGLIGLLAALWVRARDGGGRVVRTSLDQGAAMWLAGDWMSAEKPDPRFNFKIPKGVRPLIFECADGGFVHIVTGTPGSLAKLYAVLGIDTPVDPNDRGLPSPAGGLQNYFGQTELLARFSLNHARDALLEALWREGVAAEAVCQPGESWDDPQVVVNGVIETTTDGVRRVGNPIRMQVGPSHPRPFASKPSVKTGDAPLAGVRIVDFGTFVAGPYASKLLADLGAEVIKVEPPTGDQSRMLYRSFHSVNAGKLCICVDGKSQDGLDIIKALCASADVVHHNYRPGVAERLGVDPAGLRKLKADVVTLESFAYGPVGPKALNSGFDMIMQALCGHERRNGGAGNPPLWVRSALVDYAAGALGAIAILSGLLERDAAGSAVGMEVNLLNSGLWMISELIQRADGEFVGAGVNNASQTGFNAFEAFYRTRDGWLAVAARSESARAGLLELLGLAPQPDSPELGGAIAGKIATLASDDLLVRLNDAGVWAERCVEQGWPLPGQAEGESEGRVARSQDPLYGGVAAIGRLAHISGVTFPTGLSSSRKGGDTDKVLTGLGYSASQIEALRDKNVVL